MGKVVEAKANVGPRPDKVPAWPGSMVDRAINGHMFMTQPLNGR